MMLMKNKLKNKIKMVKEAALKELDHMDLHISINDDLKDLIYNALMDKYESVERESKQI